MIVARLRTLELEICKAPNKLYPAFIEEIFHRTKWLTRTPSNTQINFHKTAKHGDKSLREPKRTLGPYVWTSLPEHIN